MIIFYNLKENTVKEIEKFINDRERKVAFFASDSITEVNKIIEAENKSVLVFKRGDLKRSEIESIKQKPKGTKSLFFHFVEIDEKTIENAKVMVLAKFRRLKNSKIHPRSLKPTQKVVLDEKVSRREILGIFSKILKPGYEVIPYISSSDFCESCRICVSMCPLDAIRIEKGKMCIDKDKCAGCGLCVNFCPSQAIIFPTLKEIDVEVETLLLESSKPVIEFYCKKDAENIFDPSSSSLPLEVQCVFACSLLTMLKLFLFSDVLLRCSEDCKYNNNNNNNNNSNFNFINFIEKISGKIDKEEIRKIKNKELFLKEKSLKKLILKLKEEFKIKGVIEDAPFGFVGIDKEKCTVCGICAENCPRNALSINRNNDCVNITFDNLLCSGCKLCKKICPENAIEIKKILDFDNSRVSLIKDEYKRCKSCNEIIAPLSLYNKINKKVGIKTDNLEYCPRCRIMNQIK